VVTARSAAGRSYWIGIFDATDARRGRIREPDRVGRDTVKRLRISQRLSGRGDQVQIFIPALQRTLKLIAVIALIGAIVVPVGWGYEQRQQARTWQETACAYQLRDVTRGTQLIATIERRGNACAVLRELGFAIAPIGP